MAGITTVTLIIGLTSCSNQSNENFDPAKKESVTLTYWASNQGASLTNDAEILQPELNKFEKQSGIKVKLEVVPWSDLTNNTLAVAVSGQGPDVINIGNTNSVTFQSTNAFYPFDDAAFKTIGGKDRFIQSALSTGGAPGQDPTSLPLYSQVYGLFYNIQMFKDAGLHPPTSWDDFVATAKKFTDPAANKYGTVIPGATVNASMHFAYIFGAQNGGSPFLADGKPNFTNDGMVAGIKQYLDLLATDKVVNPSSAQYTESTQPAGDFARGNIAMLMAQTSTGNVLAKNGMNPSAYGIVPIPAPKGGKNISSFTGGTNISIFKNTKHPEAALEFVKFMTSNEEQEILTKAYTLLPVIKGVDATAFASEPNKLKTWSAILSDRAIPMARVPTVQAFQANVGSAVVGLIAKAATGSIITEVDIRSALKAAQDKMGAAG